MGDLIGNYIERYLKLVLVARTGLEDNTLQVYHNPNFHYGGITIALEQFPIIALKILLTKNYERKKT